MKVYIVVGMESSSFDWDIIRTVFSNSYDARNVCHSLNNNHNGWVWAVKEMELK